MTAMKAALPATMALSLPLIARPATAKAGRMPAKERGHTCTPDNGGEERLVAEETKQSKCAGMLERELGA